MDNRELILKVNQAFAANDANALLQYCTDDIVWNMIGDTVLRGKTAIRQMISEMSFKEPPEIAKEELIIDGDRVASLGSMKAANVKGNNIDIQYCDIYRIRDGKVYSISSYVVNNK